MPFELPKAMASAKEPWFSYLLEVFLKGWDPDLDETRGVRLAQDLFEDFQRSSGGGEGQYPTYQVMIEWKLIFSEVQQVMRDAHTVAFHIMISPEAPPSNNT